ncbi:MAG TPA: hypothetical protein PKX44_05760, partial [Methanomassiliicoccaceae archaeon]|nr:hypothetical protein [Methanomassiliicoccaceae archaeon]
DEQFATSSAASNASHARCYREVLVNSNFAPFNPSRQEAVDWSLASFSVAYKVKYILSVIIPSSSITSTRPSGKAIRKFQRMVWSRDVQGIDSPTL